MSNDKTNKRMSTGIGLFSDIRVHEIHVSLFSYSVTIQHRAKKKKVFHSKLQFNWQTYLERFTDWWLNEHAHISFLSVFLNIKLHVSFLHKNNNNLSSGQDNLRAACQISTFILNGSCKFSFAELSFLTISFSKMNRLAR